MHEACECRGVCRSLDRRGAMSQVKNPITRYPAQSKCVLVSRSSQVLVRWICQLVAANGREMI